MRRGILPISISVLALAAGCASHPRSAASLDSGEETQLAASQGGAADPEARGRLIRELNQKSCPAKAASFDEWVARFQSFAINQGRPDKVIEAAFLGIKENPEISDRASKQPEFVTPIWTYLDRAVSPERVALGREMYALHRSTVMAVSKKYGISDGVLMGIWGIETDFGRNFGDTNVFEALSNLGYYAGRHEFACTELMAAIDIVARDKVAPGELVGSWAGAMGHPQFLPSNYLTIAIDEDGSGAPDLWSSMADVFASTANHLKQDGWQSGQPWGFEVSLPKDFPYAEAELDQQQTIAHWHGLGVTKADGTLLPDLPGKVAILLLAGWRGPAFLVTQNFGAILKYNFSTSYALSVAVLGDRVKGRIGITSPWPVEEQPLSQDERHEAQELLATQGFEPGKIDGVLGLRSRKAARAFQAKIGWPADGFINKALLAALRERRAS